jgi:hypothetical protein
MNVCRLNVPPHTYVGFSKDTPKPPADCSNEMGEAVVIGAQKIHDNNTNTNNLDLIFSHYPSQSALEPTRPTSPTPMTRC